MIGLLLVQCAVGIAAALYAYRLGKRAGREERDDEN